MGKVVLLLLLATASAADWSVVLEKAESAVVRLEMQDHEGGHGTCTGSVINAAAGFILTAAHCVEGRVDITVNGRHAVLAKANRILDLAVVRTTPHPSYRTLPVGTVVPKMGAEVAVVGFPFGAEKLHAQFGHVSRKTDEGELAVNADIIPGNSGGPLLNASGELVGVNVAVRYRGPSHMGLAVALTTVRDFVEQYLPVVK